MNKYKAVITKDLYTGKLRLDLHEVNMHHKTGKCLYSASGMDTTENLIDHAKMVIKRIEYREEVRL